MNKLHIQFNQFDGPLDLLLSLIDKKKMEISEVSLSTVTETFLDYVDSHDAIGAEELADFLVIATKLLLLKSKTLLPQLSIEEDEGVSLEEQLRLYRKFVQASKCINSLWVDNSRIGFQRIESVRIGDIIVCPPNFSKDLLYTSIQNLIRRRTPVAALSQTHVDKTVSMKQKIDILRNLLKKNKQVSFKKLLGESESKTDIIISFLALLEMVKQRHVSLHQKKSFDDIVIKRV